MLRQARDNEIIEKPNQPLGYDRPLFTVYSLHVLPDMLGFPIMQQTSRKTTPLRPQLSPKPPAQNTRVSAFQAEHHICCEPMPLILPAGNQPEIEPGNPSVWFCWLLSRETKGENRRHSLGSDHRCPFAKRDGFSLLMERKQSKPVEPIFSPTTPRSKLEPTMLGPQIQDGNPSSPTKK